MLQDWNYLLEEEKRCEILFGLWNSLHFPAGYKIRQISWDGLAHLLADFRAHLHREPIIPDVVDTSGDLWLIWGTGLSSSQVTLTMSKHPRQAAEDECEGNILKCPQTFWSWQELLFWSQLARRPEWVSEWVGLAGWACHHQSSLPACSQPACLT